MIEDKQEFKSMSKKELIAKCSSLKGNLAKLSSLNNGKQALIRSLNLRLCKIRNSIDYLIQHNYSKDTSNKGKKHERDGLNLAHRTGLLKRVRREKNESR